jgi:cell division septation protein DedD
VASQQGDSFESAFAVTEGDSAIAALLSAAETDPEDPRAGEALMRAGFLAYVMEDAEYAAELFELAEKAGARDAELWRGLALLSEGRTEAASQCLRGIGGGTPDGEAAALARAACDLIEGDAGLGEAGCREIIDKGGPYAIAASLLLRRSVPGALDPEENDRWVGLLAERRPLSYEAVLAQNLPTPEEEAPPVEEEEIVDEDTEAGAETEDVPEGVPSERGDEGEAASPKEFCVQVGAFADVRNAEALVQDLLAKGYAAVRVESETRKGTLYHCVRVGRFESRDDALAKALELERDEELGTQVMESRSQAAHE